MSEPGRMIPVSGVPPMFVFINKSSVDRAAGRGIILSFNKLNLHPNLLKAIDACGFDKPTDIQREAIPVVLSGRDLMASAQTGTGKTAAFVLPALQQLLTPASNKGRGPRVLVLTPTRELAIQVNDNIRQFSRFSKFVTGTVVGGMPYPPQMKMLRKPLDLLVATPGRLMDHMESGRVDFSRLEMLVLDEADRMLDMGFVNDVKTIARAMPETRQTLLFSATLEGAILKIAKQILKDPTRIQLASNNERHASISQHAHRVDDIGHKHKLLSHYANNESLSQALIFTATKRNADRLSKRLMADGHASAALHGDMSQNKRKRTVDNMRRGKIRLLVATDVAARGLDIKGISHVINFDMPMVAEDYIHRIGRTGRAGAKGTAISLVGPDDRYKLNAIQRLTGSDLNWAVIQGLEPTSPEPRGGRPGTARGKKPYQGKRRGGQQ
ncbi:MAG TPA: DEAD/DEAH box helicase, partial [Acidiferrobacteraceae bacterium]|nr:DEAD/DEAH box helicase [Acidiferrobacteraceae bacterium]HEX20653.1 DEAD/DEAH box helicase [Acidiferrobacteraceae bacterium]